MKKNKLLIIFIVFAFSCRNKNQLNKHDQSLTEKRLNDSVLRHVAIADSLLDNFAEDTVTYIKRKRKTWDNVNLNINLDSNIKDSIYKVGDTVIITKGGK